MSRLRAALGNARSQLGQVAWVTKRYPPARIRRQAGVIRRMSDPGLRPSRNTGAVWGVSVVRDEADVLPEVMDHLFDQGVDVLLIADNGSQDGTREILAARAAADPRVIVVEDGTTAHLQSEKVTWLAHLAWRSGADWIVPFDGDEFWFARGARLADALRAQPADVGVVHADFHHMVPTAPVRGPLREAEFMMDTAPSDPGKVAARSHPFMEVGPGNHFVSRIGRQVGGLAIAHAQYRGPEQVARKVRQGAASAAKTGEDLSWFSPHWVAGARLSDDEIREVFAAMSAGRPEPRIGYLAAGPMMRLRPLAWSTWDEESRIGTAAADRQG